MYSQFESLDFEVNELEVEVQHKLSKDMKGRKCGKIHQNLFTFHLSSKNLTSI